MHHQLLLGFLALIPSVYGEQVEIPSTSTVTTTETVQTTVTQTVMAIGGIFQNIAVNLDNGNGHVWDYSTNFVTGDRVLTLYPTSRSDCAAIYVYSEYVMTTIETPSSPATSSVAKVRSLAHRQHNPKGLRSSDTHMKAAKLHDILKGIVLSGSPVLEPLKLDQSETDDVITI